MKYVIGNFKKVLNREETEKKLNEYELSFAGDKIYFCVIPECSELDSRFKLFSQQDDSCGRVLLGHSDFKACFHLTDEDVLNNAIENLKIGTQVLFCVGENKQEKESRKTKKVLKKQLSGLKKYAGDNLIIVYEPVYALGQNVLPNLNDVRSNVVFIKKLLKKSSVVYGGSVDDQNVKQVLDIKEIDGVFVHRASLFKDKITKIVSCAKSY